MRQERSEFARERGTAQCKTRGLSNNTEQQCTKIKTEKGRQRQTDRCVCRAFFHSFLNLERIGFSSSVSEPRETLGLLSLRSSVVAVTETRQTERCVQKTQTSWTSPTTSSTSRWRYVCWTTPPPAAIQRPATWTSPILSSRTRLTSPSRARSVTGQKSHSGLRLLKRAQRAVFVIIRSDVYVYICQNSVLICQLFIRTYMYLYKFCLSMLIV